MMEYWEEQRNEENLMEERREIADVSHLFLLLLSSS